MKIIKQTGIIFSICWISLLIEHILPIPFPASIIGMVLLLLALIFRALSIEHIREKSDFLLSNMAFFFIPAGVSIMNYFHVLGDYLLPFLLICTFSTIITFISTAFTVQLVIKFTSRRKQ